MDWDDKCKMDELLNNELYQEAVDFFGKQEDWDDQAVTMFVNGFDLTQYELLASIKERLNKLTTPDYRTAIRLAFIQKKFEENL
jgi:hypothetical protein